MRGHYQNTILHRTARLGKLPLVRRLVIAGADLEARDVMGATPLMTAVSAGCVKAVKYLVSAGADYNTVNGEGQNLLFAGVLAGDVKLLKYLVDLGLDVNCRDETGCTPLEYMITISPDIRLVKFLLAQGAIITDGVINYINEMLLDFYGSHEMDAEYTEIKNIKAHLQGIT